jgi:hypothetical protein
MLADSDLDSPVFIERLTRLITDEDHREDMRQALRRAGNSQARQTLAHLIVEMATGTLPAPEGADP